MRQLLQGRFLSPNYQQILDNQLINVGKVQG